MSPESNVSNGSSFGTHPRRKPAGQSVSLVHSPRQPNLDYKRQEPLTLRRNISSASSMDVDLASEVSPKPSSKPSCTKESSGESSNPERWFESSNNNVKHKGISISHDEPPFFLRQTSSDNSHRHLARQREDQQAACTIPDVTKIFAEDSDSGSEDFRSVIDDLTIENQRLKRRLKKYERMHNAHLDTEALFEVRVHGLPAPKKRELEEMLRNFVTKMEKSNKASRNPANKSSGPASLLPHHTSSTTSRVGDSGYHSLSMSGHNSASMSGHDKKAQSTSVSNANFDNDIQNYLWDIPVGLQPQDHGPVSEKEKKKTIVRRLEQLFAGRDPSASGHQQPIQQQKLAQSAARADRRATQAAGDVLAQEGSRVARIMSNSKTALTTRASQSQEEMPKPVSATTTKMEIGRDTDSEGIVEQRPTRPLDLDPYRAQVPEENMEYIRHLGFSPPHFDVEAQKDGHGWIYLNVLHNMAQLHLTNVTVDFVRKSIIEYSKKLEISPDGRKLRWRGGFNVTYTSSNNSPDHVENSVSWRQHGTEGESSTYNGSSMSGAFGGQKAKNKFAYSPLFRRQQSSSGESSVQNMSNMYTGSNIRSYGLGAAHKGSQAADNPMIFYTNAGFYTDLSGDPDATRDHDLGNHGTIATTKLLGSKTTPEQLTAFYGLDSEKGPLSRVALDKPKKSLASLSSGSVNVVAHSSPSESSFQSLEPVDFEVSGLGGVYPADNFAIEVKTCQKQKLVSSNEDIPLNLRRKAYPKRIQRMLQTRKSVKLESSSLQEDVVVPYSRKPVVQREILSSKHEALPASQLPQGNFFHASEDSDSDEDMLDYDSEDDEPTSENLAHVQRVDWAIPNFLERVSTDSDSDVDAEDDFSHTADDADDRSEESMDLLAAARAIDPESVRLREREFDSNLAERLAEDIPPGSSAATAEGGSGFNSPNLTKDGVSGLSIARNTGSVRGPRPSMGPPQQIRPANLKRHRTSEDSGFSKGTAMKSPKINKCD